MDLTDKVVDIIFHVFHANCHGNLSSEEFLRSLQRRESDIPTSNFRFPRGDRLLAELYKVFSSTDAAPVDSFDAHDSVFVALGCSVFNVGLPNSKFSFIIQFP